MRAIFSSKRQDWATPWEVFRQWDLTFGPFTLDVCATAHNAKCKRYFSPEDNGLVQTWSGICWMNPPYGRGIDQWLDKAALEVRAGHALRVVCLLPARTDSAWWHDLIFPRCTVYFLRGRIRFEGAAHSAPFPSAIVLFE